MICFGLDEEGVRQIYVHGQQKFKEPTELKSSALIGLKNFFDVYPEKLVSRLSKGPPPCYRWVAWRFMSMQIMERDEARYKQLVEEGADNKCLYDIDKDLGRTYPTHPLFDPDKKGTLGQKILRNML